MSNKKKAFQARRKRIVLGQGPSAFGLGIMGMGGDHGKGKGTGIGPTNVCAVELTYRYPCVFYSLFLSGFWDWNLTH